jgi:hypothetical protein
MRIRCVSGKETIEPTNSSCPEAVKAQPATQVHCWLLQGARGEGGMGSPAVISLGAVGALPFDRSI